MDGGDGLLWTLPWASTPGDASYAWEAPIHPALVSVFPL